MKDGSATPGDSAMSRMLPPKVIPMPPAAPVPKATLYAYCGGLHKIEGKQMSWEVAPTVSSYDRWQIKIRFLKPTARSRGSGVHFHWPCDAVIIEGWEHLEIPPTCWRQVPSCLPGLTARTADPEAFTAFLAGYLAESGTTVIADFRMPRAEEASSSSCDHGGC